MGAEEGCWCEEGRIGSTGEGCSEHKELAKFSSDQSGEETGI